MILIWLWGGGLLLLGTLKLGWWGWVDQWWQRHLPDRRTRRFWRLVAVVGQPLVAVALIGGVAAWLCYQGQFWPAGWGVAVLGSADVMGLIIKHSFPRSRPAKHLAQDNDASFPSGHVLGATLAGLIIWAWFPSWWMMGLVMVAWLLVTWSRLVLRAHHLSDVIITVWLAITWFTTWYWLW